jgi:membrane-bound lytic murein transglycosylase B
MRIVLKLVAIALATAWAGQAAAATCRNTGSYEQWLAAFKKEALAQGISAKVIAEASPSMTFDPAIIKRDHGQSSSSPTA